MSTLRSFSFAALLGLTMLPTGGAMAQCTNNFLNPGWAVLPDQFGQVTTISNCSLMNEFSWITGVNFGSTYEFTITNGGYITLHDGANNGPVLASGYSPLQYVAFTFNDIYPTWTVDDQCNLNNVLCNTTTVQQFLNCTPPTASYVITEDCVNSQWSLSITVSSTGDGASVTLDYSVNGGGITSTPGLGVGTYNLGPFATGSTVDVTIAHEFDSMCNLVWSGLTDSGNCATLVDCAGAQVSETYCYLNSDNQNWTYHGNGGFPLALLFSQGTIESVSFDHLNIYDGTDNTGTLLYSHTIYQTEDLTNLLVVSLSPDMYMEMYSDGSVSCADGYETSWAWTVGCLDCNPAQATFDVILDCANNQFTVEVDLTAIGSDAVVDITNDGGAPTVTATTPGVYSVGPFPDGTQTTVTLENDSNSLCNLESPLLSNFPCPIISCGPDNYIYCYNNSEETYFVYQSATTFPIALIFNSGAMYQYDADQFTIYDGLNALAPVQYTGDYGGQPLDGLLYTSTNPDNALTLGISSDNYTSCVDYLQIPFNYTVACLDCTNPAATYTVVPDCAHRSYTVDIDITGTGTATTADVYNSFAQDTTFALPVGLHTFGPIPMDTVVHFTVFNSNNSLCRLQSGDMTYSADSCIILSCGIDNYTYCYVNDDDAWYTYQADGPYPITITFQQGDMLSGDRVIIYNGSDDYAALVYNGNQSGDLTGLAQNSSNPDNIITLRILADETGSCADAGVTNDMHWTVGCGYVGLEDEVPGGFSVFPNPTDGSLYLQLNSTWTGSMRVNLVDMMGRNVMEQMLTVGGGITQKLDLRQVAAGNYMLQLVTNDLMKTQQLVIAR